MPKAKDWSRKEPAQEDLPDLVLRLLIEGIGKPSCNVKIGIDANRRIDVGKKKDADRSGIGIKITGIARSSSTIGSKTSSYQLLETALSAMVMIGMIDGIGSIRTMIGVLVGRLEEEPQFMIGWGTDSVCMIGLVSVSSIFLGTKRSSRRWRMRESPMSSYFVEMLILIG